MRVASAEILPHSRMGDNTLNKTIIIPVPRHTQLGESVVTQRVLYKLTSQSLQHPPSTDVLQLSPSELGSLELEQVHRRRTMSERNNRCCETDASSDECKANLDTKKEA